MTKAPKAFHKQCRKDYGYGMRWIRVTHMPTGKWAQLMSDKTDSLTLENADQLIDCLYNEIDTASNTGKIDK